MAKNSLPNKKNPNSKNGGGRSKRTRNSKGGRDGLGGRDLVSGYMNAATSLSRVSEGFMPLFPPRTRKVLRYHDNVSVATVSGAVATYVFRANDLFDPNFTGTGHQPMGFDQMMVFYNHFAVDKCRITVNAANTAAGSLHAGVRLDASSTALTSADQILEFGGVTYDVLEAKNAYGSSKTFGLNADIARVQGIPRRNITTDATLRGDSATSPTEITYFHLLVWDPNALSGTVNFDVTMEFGAYFMEPRDATLSLSKKPSQRLTEETKKSSPSGWF